MDLSKTVRNPQFRSIICKAFSFKCALSGMDEIQCDAAHIIPKDRNDTAPNGMFLSRELHSSYDRYIWCINPSSERICEHRPGFSSYTIEISDKYKDKKLSIDNYKYKSIEVKSWSREFIVKAYRDYKQENYPEDFQYIDESLKEDNRVNCEYCGEEYTKKGMKKHHSSCRSKCPRKDN